MGQFGHVISLVELGRVDFVDRFGIHLSLLAGGLVFFQQQ